MPLANVRGVNINYKVLGNHGPWVALSPGGRRDISGIERLAGEVAKTGHRVVVFDRRNCGASDVVIDGDDSEYEIWADDIHELLRQLGALPAFIGGSYLFMDGAELMLDARNMFFYVATGITPAMAMAKVGSGSAYRPGYSSPFSGTCRAFRISRQADSRM